ncbi:MAG: hypothetical protein KatS3mg027_1641 [Bacteroidia bacterium]|nr:MAG: hypothetical protein KatS3mg027_1641 [Bacteroidia bacterium]
MKKFFIIFMYLTSWKVFILHSQTYFHPTSGIAGTYVGNCMVNTCSGTYYDNGGVSGNYSNNIGDGAGGGIYRVFCPNAPGQCIQVSFSSFNVECANPPCTLCYDYLSCIQSATQNGPVAWLLCSNGSIIPPITTATNSSGCLSFRFYSDASINRAGWVANISCVPCSANSTPANTDCTNAIGLCGNTGASGIASSPGLTSEACTGCTAGGENYSAWYTFSVQTSGVLSFTISPTSSNDYDFALYGPNVSCNSLGTPIRCSYAAGNGNTGLSPTAADVSEDVTGNSWVSRLNVTAGQIYYLMINDWDGVGNGFNLTFSSGGSFASLSCAYPLPVELTTFECTPEESGILLHWQTATEHNNKEFVVEKSEDGINFTEYKKVMGKGTSYTPNDYLVFDNSPYLGENYYRIKQVDFDGTSTYSKIISCSLISSNDIFDLQILNLMGQVLFSYKGVTRNEYEAILNNVPNGIYFVTLSQPNSNKKLVSKVNIIH